MALTQTALRETHDKKIIKKRLDTTSTISPTSLYDNRSNNGASSSNNKGLYRDSLEEGDTLEGYRISLEDYWSKIYDNTERVYEWNNGVLEEKPRMAQLRKYWMCKWFVNLLYDYLYVHPIATIIESDMGFELSLPNRTRVRGPDVGVVLNTNPAPLGEWDRSYQGIFDLCIELISDSKPHHITRDTQEKRTEYAQAGVPEYFILDESRPPRPNETAFYQLGPNGIYQPILPINGVIISSVLPGFQFRRDHLFTRPDPVTLLDDPVYQGFISPQVRAERQQVLAERQQMLAERQRAEQAEQTLASVQAYLASIGVELPDNLN
ncbi:MAG: Uma2 family endonuclease [Chloroflexota bacterium]